MADGDWELIRGLADDRDALEVLLKKREGEIEILTADRDAWKLRAEDAGRERDGARNLIDTYRVESIEARHERDMALEALRKSKTVDCWCSMGDNPMLTRHTAACDEARAIVAEHDRGRE